jgi:hypothetical protein
MASVLVGIVGVVAVCGQGLGQVAPARPSVPAPVVERGVIAEAAGTGERVDLRSSWVKGEVAAYEFEIAGRWSTRMGEEEEKKIGQAYRQEGRLARRVLGVDEGGVTLAFTIERLRLLVSSGVESMHFDSEAGDNPERANPLSEAVKAVVGRPVTVRVDKAGKLVSVEGNGEAEGDPGKPESSRAQIIKGVLGASVIRDLWKPLYGIEKRNPDSRVGDRWTTESTTIDPSLGTFGLTLRHELKEVREGVARIETIAEVEFTGAAGKGAARTTLAESAAVGEAEWDVMRGTLKHWTTSQEMKIDQEIAGQKQRIETGVTTSFVRAEGGEAKDKKDAKRPAKAAPSETGGASKP